MALPTCAARAATSSLFTTSTHAAASACCTRPAQPGAPSSALHSFVRRLHSTARRAGVPCEGCGRRAAGCGLRAAGGHRRPPAPRRCSASAQSPPASDQTCPISTEGWTRRVHFVREGGGGLCRTVGRRPPRDPLDGRRARRLGVRARARARARGGGRPAAEAPRALGASGVRRRHARNLRDAACPISTG